jgi:hypothetical protein
MNKKAFISLLVVGMCIGGSAVVSAQQRVFVGKGVISIQNGDTTTTVHSATSTSNQSTSLSVDTTELTLFIKASPNTQFQGSVSLNGKEISQLRSTSTILTLSPFLRPGKQVLQIVGTYTPPNRSVSIQLLGSSTQVSLSTAGNGTISQNINLNVQK